MAPSYWMRSLRATNKSGGKPHLVSILGTDPFPATIQRRDRAGAQPQNAPAVAGRLAAQLSARLAAVAAPPAGATRTQAPPKAVPSAESAPPLFSRNPSSQQVLEKQS